MQAADQIISDRPAATEMNATENRWLGRSEAGMEGIHCTVVGCGTLAIRRLRDKQHRQDRQTGT